MPNGHKTGKYFRSVASLTIEGNLVDFFLKTLKMDFYRKRDTDGRDIIHQKLKKMNIYPKAKLELNDNAPIIMHVFMGVTISKVAKQSFPLRNGSNLSLVRPKITHSLAKFFYNTEAQIISDHFMKFFTNKDVLFVEVYRAVHTDQYPLDLKRIYHIHRRAERRIYKKMTELDVCIEHHKNKQDPFKDLRF